MSYAAWVTTVICLIGTALNSKKKISCFLFWGIGNILWFIMDIRSGMYSRAILDLVQLLLGVYGWYEWKKE